MVINSLDGISFRLKRHRDFSWLKKYGTAFCVIDETGSGCICIGMQNGNKKYFCKIAGVETIEAEIPRDESIEVLKNSVRLYNDLQHPNLTRVIEHYEYEDMYVVVYDWVEGECLFDHWNFEKYHKNPHIVPPADRFKQLPISKRIKSADVLFSFLDTVSKKGYVAVDSYDGSIMYDFSRDVTTICDIDFFRKKPTFNDMGENYWGTKRLKAPEECVYGAVIDEATNVFTLGALLFDNYFGNFTDAEVSRRYEMNAFTPCSFEKWELNKASYDVALKAVSKERSDRFATIDEFYKAWKAALLSK